MDKKSKKILLIGLIFLVFVLNYNFLDNRLENFFKDYEEGIVERVVDGDTLIINGNSTRLLGINTPEKGEKGYNEAREFLEKELLNKTVRLEFGKDRFDIYNRKLGYVIFNEENINIKTIEKGYANLYIVDRDEYSEKLKQAWQICLKNNKNLCEKSYDKCANCVLLNSIDLEKQQIELYNNCNFSCYLTNWTIKDEGRKKFIFPEYNLKAYDYVRVIVGNKTSDLNNLYWKRGDYVWTKTGDSLFLRDGYGGLVLWKYINRN